MTVLTLKRGDRIIEVDDLSEGFAPIPDAFAVFENGQQIAEFMTSTPFGPMERPIAELAWEAVDETEAEDAA